MFALMLALLWVGVVCLHYRQLHQTSALSVGVMEEPYRETLECTEEDITDKVRAGLSAILEHATARNALQSPGRTRAGASLAATG